MSPAQRPSIQHPKNQYIYPCRYTIKNQKKVEKAIKRISKKLREFEEAFLLLETDFNTFQAILNTNIYKAT